MAMYSENNAMYVNEGGGVLRKAMEGAFVTDGGDAKDLEVADIDGDGDVDILVANYGQNCGEDHSDDYTGEKNAMYINDGEGELRKRTEGAFVTNSGCSTGVDAVDIDGDDDLDVLVATTTGRYSANIDIYINDGEGELQKVTEGAFVTDVHGTTTM
jgi:hypothetical protein